MLLTSIRAVHIDIPRTPSKSAPRREPWPRYAPRAMPINHYAEFSRLPQEMPGAGLPEVWVQAIAADGATGYGRCSFGQPVASYIDHIIAPLIEGRDCMAIELMNDLVIRAGHPPRHRRTGRHRLVWRGHRPLGPQGQAARQASLRTLRRSGARPHRAVCDKRPSGLEPRTRFHTFQDNQPSTLQRRRRGTEAD